MESDIPVVKKSRKKLWIGLAAALILLFIIIDASSGSGSKTTATAPTTVETRAVTTTVNQVRAWAASNASTFQTIGKDLTSVGNDSNNVLSQGGYSTLSQACVKLGSDVKSAQSASPIPDAALEQKWSQILAQLSTASDDCVQGIANVDANQIAQMSPIMNELGPELQSLTSGLANA